MSEFKLSDFPTFVTQLPEDSAPEAALASTYIWAGRMIEIHGSAAPYYALNAMLWCIRDQKPADVYGWQGVMNAIAELGRVAGEDDAVH